MEALQRTLMIAAVSLMGSSCNMLPVETIKVLYVAPTKAPCQTIVQTTCLQTREAPDQNWDLFYSNISGFVYEEGFSYKIRVGVKSVPNPPADGSSLSYRLLEQLEKTPVTK
jgi:hypothetical protein